MASHTAIRPPTPNGRSQAHRVVNVTTSVPASARVSTPATQSAQRVTWSAV